MPGRRDLRKYFKGLVKEVGSNFNEINRIRMIPMDAGKKQKLIDAYLRSLSPEKRKKLMQLRRFLLDESMKKYFS